NRITKIAMSHSLDLVVTDKVGKIFLIGINRPEKRNCVNSQTAAQLVQAFRTFENDDSLRVAVLHGKGGNFCAGFDLSQLSEGGVSPENFPDPNDGLGPMGPSKMVFNKPVIAAVSGYAVAGGLELSLMCDMRIVEETAIMGVFCRRFGVPLIDGGTVRLPALIGLSRAMDMILTGRGVSANEALQMGLANRVVPIGTAVGEAVKIAQTISNFPQECMLRDRKSAYHATYDAPSHTDAMCYELDNAKHVINLESVQGAGRFVTGAGKGGKFNIDKPTSKL
ncbi:unnamed protein product, partial [Owenia fusiformis]